MKVVGGVWVGDGAGVEISAMHVQFPETTSQVPNRQTISGQIIPGVHGGHSGHVPPHGFAAQGSVGEGVGIGVEIPGTQPQLSETTSQCPSTQGANGQIMAGAHGGQIVQVPLQGDPLQGSVGVGGGVAVGVRSGTQLHIVHSPTDSHTFSSSGRQLNGGSGGQVGVVLADGVVVGVGIDNKQGIAQQGTYGGKHRNAPQQQ